MNYYIDFEFLEDGRTIDPISFGMVSEDERELYIQFKQDADFEARLTPWLWENVMPHLSDGPWLTRKEAQTAILDFIGEDRSIRFWGYYADYDWVVFCQLFGRMIDLPKGFPMFCMDIKQLCDSLGGPKLPEQTSGEHNALADARWNRVAHDFLRSDDFN